MSSASDLVQALRRHRARMAPVLPMDLTTARVAVLDFSSGSASFAAVDPNDAAAFTDLVLRRLEEQNAEVGVGRYDEDRVIYRHSPLFNGAAERRSVHLGIDLFVTPLTAVSTPLDATLHSCADNAALGDYGPTIVLEHELAGIRFFTLYGHLTRRSLEGLEPGRSLASGTVVGAVGTADENGGWPPHLHFQIIRHMGEKRGDFPGVAAPSRRLEHLKLCPDPNLILGIPALETVVPEESDR